MSKLFSPISLRGLSLPNRIAVSPMCQYVAEDGVMDDWHLMNLGQYAMAAAGLVFCEATHVSDIGRITPGCVGLWNDEQEAAIKRVVDFCKRYGVSALGVQLAHAGRKASTQTPLDGGKPLSAQEGAWQTLGPSETGFAPDWPTPKEMDAEDLRRVRDEFVASAKRSLAVGFDTIELHCGHGYLLNQFFSPLSNQRTDDYGGTLENRMRYPLEVFNAVRAVCPDDTPIGVRISAIDWVDGGTTIEDTIALSRALEEHGCDYIDITSAGIDYRQKITVGPGYQVPFASAVKNAVSIPVMAVGMITEAQQAETIISSGEADFAMLARAMMDDPHWTWHAARELGADTAYAPQYVRCRPDYWTSNRREK